MNVLKAADALPEYTLKAAYLYNFALLTNWPTEADKDKFKMCFYKQDLGIASDQLNDKKIHDKNVKVYTMENSKDFKECDLVYIREEEVVGASELIASLKQLPILIVSENLKNLHEHITILEQERRLVFDISLDAIKETKLSLSSHLLKLAQSIKQ
jgi:hypothetical protein